MFSAPSSLEPEQRFLAQLYKTFRGVVLEQMPVIAYTIRTSLSCALALWLAAFWQINSPLSAATTVLIVANPVSGAMRSKSAWRIFGTLIGSSFAVLVMSAFPQQPLLFFVALSLVICAACYVATLLTAFRAYAAVLSGYTIIVILAGTFTDPSNVFLAAMDRLSVVTTGILCTAFVFMITTVSRPQGILLKFHTFLRDVLSLFTSLTPEQDDDDPRAYEAGQDGAFRALNVETYTNRSRLLAQVTPLVMSLEMAASEDADIRQRAPSLRIGLARLVGLLSVNQPAWLVPEGKSAKLVQRARRLSAGLMQDIASAPVSSVLNGDAGKMSSRISKVQQELEEMSGEATDTFSLAAVDSERSIVTALGEAWACLVGENIAQNIRLPAFFEWHVALRNALRGLIVTFLGCLIWYVFSWGDAIQMLTFLVPGACLMAISPSVTQTAVMLSSGMLCAIPFSFLFHMLFLPRVDGYPLLCFGLVIFLVPGIMAQFQPRYAAGGLGYSVFFNVMAQVKNPITPEDISLINLYLAFAVGAAVIVVVSTVVLPVNLRLDCARLVSSLTESTQNMARFSARIGSRELWIRWEYHQMQKVFRLTQRLSAFVSPARVFEVTDAAFMTVSLGRIILQLHILRHIVQEHSLEYKALLRVLDSFRFLRHDPLKTSGICRDEAHTILASGNYSNLPDSSRRLASCMIQAEHLIASAPGFFYINGPMQVAKEHPEADAPLRTLPADRIHHTTAGTA